MSCFVPRRDRRCGYHSLSWCPLSPRPLIVIGRTLETGAASGAIRPMPALFNRPPQKRMRSVPGPRCPALRGETSKDREALSRQAGPDAASSVKAAMHATDRAKARARAARTTSRRAQYRDHRLFAQAGGDLAGVPVLCGPDHRQSRRRFSAGSSFHSCRYRMG